MLGVSGGQAAAVASLPEPVSLDTPEINSVDFPQNDFSPEAATFQFAPTINIQGSADKATIKNALAETMQDFEARMDAWWAKKQRMQARTVYR